MTGEPSALKRDGALKKGEGGGGGGRQALTPEGVSGVCRLFWGAMFLLPRVPRESSEAP